MPADPKQEGLIVSGSDVPVLRAGWSNIILFVLLVWSVLINQVLKDIGIAPFVRGVVVLGLCLAGLKVYSHSVSRIFIKNGKTLVLIGPLAATEIDADDILETDVSGIPSSSTVLLKVKRRTSLLPTFYYFATFVTNYGGYDDTRAKLLSLLERLTRCEP